jgi:catechol 2,3-dioxygenase-like lactoylglutathione lyase family enzyme
MSAQGRIVQGISHVELRVRNLDESAKFYVNLLGLERRSVIPPSAKTCECGATTDSGSYFSIVLAEGLPNGVPVSGVDHVSFAVSTDDDVIAVYEKARTRQVPATEPRMYDGHYQTFIFDPNGYKIEVISSEG